MSNCINIHRRNLLLKKPEFDVDLFKKWFDEQPLETEEGGYAKRPSAFYYFLKDNTYFRKDSVIISIGAGHSTHTWRDFKWVLWQLNQFVTAPIEHTFTASDEYDNHKTKFLIPVKFPYADWNELYEKVTSVNKPIYCFSCKKQITTSKYYTRWHHRYCLECGETLK